MALAMTRRSDTDAQIQGLIDEQGRQFRDNAPTTAAQVILDAVKSDTWRVLVGDDAHRMDELVRADPAHAYDQGFFDNLAAAANWRLGGVRT
jgi:hypothetical protein